MTHLRLNDYPIIHNIYLKLCLSKIDKGEYSVDLFTGIDYDNKNNILVASIIDNDTVALAGIYNNAYLHVRITIDISNHEITDFSYNYQPMEITPYILENKILNFNYKDLLIKSNRDIIHLERYMNKNNISISTIIQALDILINRNGEYIPGTDISIKISKLFNVRTNYDIHNIQLSKDNDGFNTICTITFDSKERKIINASIIKLDLERNKDSYISSSEYGIEKFVEYLESTKIINQIERV